MVQNHLKWLFLENKILIWSNISWYIIKYKLKDMKYHRKESLSIKEETYIHLDYTIHNH